MNFEESDIQKEIRELSRKFAQKELQPIVDGDEKSETFRPEIIQKLGELGLTGVPTGENYGGTGLGYQELSIVIEELAAVNTTYAISVAVSGLPQIILSQFGTEEQKQKYIPPLASGTAIGAFSLSEASSGSDTASLRTTAEKKGDYYILNGTKLWCTQGDSAETLMVMARTGKSGDRGISTFLVKKDTPGFSLGKKEKKMACNSSHTMELVFDNAKIPKDQLIGKEGEGLKIALTALDSGRITIAATALGIARSALNQAVDHANEREQFGQKIIEFQGVSFLLADMLTEWNAANCLVQKAAWLNDQNKPHTVEAAMAKLFATDMAMKVTTDAVQVLGGSGYTQEFAVERWMREAKVTQIVEGTNQIQRIVIGRSLYSKKA